MAGAYHFVGVRRAFTLLELMVVMGILVALTAVALTTIGMGGDQTGPRAAAGLVADLLRQARHTALSTGTPVEVVLRRDLRPGQVRSATTPWMLEGVSNTILWSELFEDRAQWGGNSATFGFAGRGFLARATGASATGSDAFARPRLLDRDDDGLVVECRIRPPVVRIEDQESVVAVELHARDRSGNQLIVLRLGIEVRGAEQGWPDTGSDSTGATGHVRVDSAWRIWVEAPTVGLDATNADEPLRGGAWSHVRLEIAQGVARLHLGNGQSRVLGDCALRASDLRPPFQIAVGSANSAPAIIDEVRVLRTGISEQVRLPERVRLEMEGDAGVRFLIDPAGTLTATGAGQIQERIRFLGGQNRGLQAILTWADGLPRISEAPILSTRSASGAVE
jgi:prepilin-type N-terminal cleavage/methylation domain-containing protein